MRRVFACLRFLFGEVPSKLDQAAMADNDGSNLVIEKWGIAYERAHKRG